MTGAPPTHPLHREEPAVLKGLTRVGLLAALIAAFAATAATVTASPVAETAATRCPATFQVLHNDRIGAMSLPAGASYVTVNNLTCAQASTLFAQFLQDYDGDLPSPWRGNARAKSFSNGRSSFSVKLAGKTPPAPPTPGSVVTCPAAPSASSTTTASARCRSRRASTSWRSGAASPAAGASSQFALFLDQPNGVDAPWSLSINRLTASFQDNMGGFAAYRPPRSAARTPAAAAPASYTCTTFRVLHNDHVGGMYMPKGTYDIVLPVGSTMSCAAARKPFVTFLNLENVPRGCDRRRQHTARSRAATARRRRSASIRSTARSADEGPRGGGSLAQPVRTGDAIMILGMSVATFTLVHVIISLIAIATGFIVMAGMLSAKRLPEWTAVFLLFTLLTSVTGFFFPLTKIGPPHIFGVISLVLLVFTLYALYGRHLMRSWRAVYVVTALIAQYLNVVVLVVQAYQKIPTLNAIAPVGNEPVVGITQGIVLISFLYVGWRALKKFHPPADISMAAAGAV